ncbi:MAG: glutamine amidotransferase, partial [Kiritimatiellae bacterium]|nr:glutamine amidotransferase [Kiritimatiellia bacterium]
RGGALIVLGGHQSYERGGWRGSLIEDAMPVECHNAVPGGMVAVKEGLSLLIDDQAPWKQMLTLTPLPKIYYLHKAKVKPQGTVLVKADQYPLLVTGTYGEGRVACFLGMPYGGQANDDIPFWMWDDWIYLLRETCWWALKNPDLD